MKTPLIATLLILTLHFSASSQVTDSLNSQLTGYWKLKSVKFENPVDINKDGIKNTEAMKEYSACQKDQQLELNADMTATTYEGAHEKDCKPQIEHYTWKVIRKTIRKSHYEGYKRIVTESPGLVLILRGNGDSMQFLIEKCSGKTLCIKAELRDGTDSTSEAEVEYRKTKKE